MDQENFFSRLRRLANKVENESCLFQDRMQQPPDRRVASGVSAGNILKGMQYDVHKLKSDASKELQMQQSENSLQEVLKACENLIRINQRQTSSLKEHLIQYGYQPVTLQTGKTAKQKSSSEDKENAKQDTDGSTADNKNQEYPSNQRPITPPKADSGIPAGDGDKTPKMEDFGLSMNRVNLFLKKGVPTSSQKVLDYSESDRCTPLEATTVYQHSGNLNFEDSELSLCSEPPQLSSLSFRKQQTPKPQTLPRRRDQEEEPFRSDSVEPRSPSLTSWFPQETSQLPAPPLMSLRPDTCTPPTPNCQTTEMLSVMPPEPKRLVRTLEKEEPKEPDQNYPKLENITPELPPSLSDLAYRSKMTSQNSMATPVHSKNVPNHLAFLQEEGTPKTPELTMSLNQLRCRPITAVQPGPSVTQGQLTRDKRNPVSDLQTPIGQRMVPQSSSSSSSHCVHLAFITEQEFSSLSSKMKQNLSLDKVNSWIKIIDEYLVEKPLGEKVLTSEDLEALQGYPWLRAMLMLMVNFGKVERIADGEDVVFIPHAIP